MPQEVVSTLSYEGLSESKANKLLEKHGLNVLPEKPPPSDLSIFFSQLKNPLIYVLIGAGVITLVLKELADSAIIFLAVFINTFLGFFQERKAGKALEALKKLVHPHAKVVRDGKIVTLEIEKIVPGDVVVLKQGDKIPADGKLLEANRFFVNEAMLTGESEFVEKKRNEKIFMGTVVHAGNAKMKVILTGKSTEMGKIALSVSEQGDDTPLRRQLTKFSKQLSLLVFVLVAITFGVGLLFGHKAVEIFTTSVALAVSAIPEGLLVALTVVLAIGMQRILSRKGLVRNLVSAETLGGVTTICVDKTGTLTQGKMQVIDVCGDREQLVTQVLLANDLDTSVVIAAWEWGASKQKDLNNFAQKHMRLDSIPFSSETKMFVSLNKLDEENNIIYVNGAPEIVLEKTNLTDEKRLEVEKDIKHLTKRGQRVLGFAKKIISKSTTNLQKDGYEKDLEWVGFLAFDDPVREDVKEALKRTSEAGIKLIVITGDYAETAQAVLKQLDIKVLDGDIVLGKQLENMDEKTLKDRLFKNERNVKLFARTKPDQKLKIVELLKEHGEVVAMTGDGVNDAPALSKADIGIVVNEASDVAKESADLVLLDSSFSTIVAAVEEGRGIFDNIRKVILYLMSDAFEEILIVITAIVLGLPMPITAVQILWVNLVADGFPNLALTIDPKIPTIMHKPPRSPSEPIVSGWMKKLIAIVSVSGGIFAFGLYFYALKTTGSAVFARSVSFATVGINSLVYVFSIRMLQYPFWEEKFFDNKWLLGAVGIGLVLQILPFTTPVLRTFFKIEPLGWYWVYAFGASVLMFFTIETFKWVFKHRLR